MQFMSSFFDNKAHRRLAPALVLVAVEQCFPDNRGACSSFLSQLKTDAVSKATYGRQVGGGY